MTDNRDKAIMHFLDSRALCQAMNIVERARLGMNSAHNESVDADRANAAMISDEALAYYNMRYNTYINMIAAEATR